MKLFELALFMLARRAQISAWICRLWVGTDVRSSSDIQVPYLLPHRLQRRGAHRGSEATDPFRVPRAFDPPGSKAISEEVKCDVRMRSLSTVVFAVDDFGFGRMHLQAALRQAGLQLGHHGFRFSPAPTVHETIVSIPTPREVGCTLVIQRSKA